MRLNPHFSPSRLWAVLLKELVQMRRDRLTFAMMLGVPLIQLFLFGFAINNDPKGLPTALVALGQDPYSRAIVSALEVSDYYAITERPATRAEAERLIAGGYVTFVVTIPSDLGVRVLRREDPEILVEADATDPVAMSGALGALSSIANKALQRLNGQDLAASQRPAQSLSITVHKRYNPEGISQYNIVPGLLGVILQMTMVMMTAMGLTREVERGTMENLLALPATGLEIMLGKILPYLLIGAVQVLVVLGFAKAVFSVPFAGSLVLLLSAILIFVLALVQLGYTFSTIARTQMQAMQLTFFFFLPSIMLSGFMFPYRGMPGWAQTLGEVFPLTHFLRLIRSVMLKGADAQTVAQSLAALGVFVLILSLAALLRFRRTLD